MAVRVGFGQVKVSQTDLDELRAETFPVVVGAIVLGVWIATMVAFPRSSEVILLWPLGVGAVGLVSYRLLLRSVRAASRVFVGGVASAAIAATLLYPSELFGFFLAPVVLIAALLLGPRASLLVTLLCTTILAVAHPEGRLDLSSHADAMAIAMIWTIALLAWLATRSVYTALGWAWHSYGQAIEKVDELQERQGELNRLVKSLSDAYYQLEQMNRELDRARTAAQEARQLKAEFAATISHELRTPLNLIIGFSEMMATAPHTYAGDTLSPEYQCDVDAIYRNARHLSSLIDDVLDLSQIDADRMALLRERVTVADVVRQAVAVTRGLFDGKGLDLALEIPEDLPCIDVDPTRIRQVLINLFTNAARFTERGGVVVHVRLANHQIVTSVADTGPGIAPEDLRKVFDDFRQVDGSIRRRFGGSGLGLAICKRFVELHGGNVWAESSVEKGSVFSFSLPLAESVVSAPIRRDWETWARPRPPQQLDRRVLAVVDDDPTVASLFSRYLDSWDVIAVAGLADVPRLAAQAPVAAVALTDGREQDLDRSDLSLELDYPVVVCPIAGRRELRSELGVFDYLVKPIVHQQAVAILGRLPRLNCVLIADDDPEMVRLLGRMVRAVDQQIRIIGSYSGSEALAAMAEVIPDLVLLDLLMPDVDGYGVIEQMRREDRLRDVPIVVVTARGDRVEALRGRYLQIVRPGGLGAGEVFRCLAACLNILSPTSDNTDQSPQAEIVG